MSTTASTTVDTVPYAILKWWQISSIGVYRDDVLVEVATKRDVLSTDLAVVTLDPNNHNKQGRVVAVGSEQRDVAVGDWIWFASQKAIWNELKAGGKTYLVLQPSVPDKGRILLKELA